jgi:hypothetical protein
LKVPKKSANLSRAFELLAGLPNDFDPRGPAKRNKKQIPRRPPGASAAAADSE